MNVQDFRTNDTTMQALAGREPSTPFGIEIWPKWARNYQQMHPSEVYRGIASVLRYYLNRVAPPSLEVIYQVSNEIWKILDQPEVRALGDDFAGAAGIAVSNSWDKARSAGQPAYLVLAAYESEMIYVARLFLEARRREAAGERLY